MLSNTANRRSDEHRTERDRLGDVACHRRGSRPATHGHPGVAVVCRGNHDDVELATIHKCVVALQSILADHASNKDAAMGITPALKHVRRVSGNY
jgi:hypothetical protein